MASFDIKENPRTADPPDLLGVEDELLEAIYGIGCPRRFVQKQQLLSRNDRRLHGVWFQTLRKDPQKKDLVNPHYMRFEQHLMEECF